MLFSVYLCKHIRNRRIDSLKGAIPSHSVGMLAEANVKRFLVNSRRKSRLSFSENLYKLPFFAYLLTKVGLGKIEWNEKSESEETGIRYIQGIPDFKLQPKCLNLWLNHATMIFLLLLLLLFNFLIKK